MAAYPPAPFDRSEHLASSSEESDYEYEYDSDSDFTAEWNEELPLYGLEGDNWKEPNHRRVVANRALSNGLWDALERNDRGQLEFALRRAGFSWKRNKLRCKGRWPKSPATADEDAMEIDPPQAPFRLLDLPAKIRLMIYRCFDLDTVLVFRNEASPHEPIISNGTHPLAAVCSIIRKEIISLIYAQMEIIIMPPSLTGKPDHSAISWSHTLATFYAWLTGIGAQGAHHLTTIWLVASSEAEFRFIREDEQVSIYTGVFDRGWDLPEKTIAAREEFVRRSEEMRPVAKARGWKGEVLPLLITGEEKLGERMQELVKNLSKEG